MSQPKHYIQAKYKGCTWRYYGWSHVPGATCIGEGEWRTVSGGKEYRTWGSIVPANVMAAVVAELKLREKDKAS